MGRASPAAVDDEHINFCRPIGCCVFGECTKLITLLKIVYAVRAGCIPVYHAHATVKTSFLSGARWIDPADFRVFTKPHN